MKAFVCGNFVFSILTILIVLGGNLGVASLAYNRGYHVGRAEGLIFGENRGLCYSLQKLEPAQSEVCKRYETLPDVKK